MDNEFEKKDLVTKEQNDWTINKLGTCEGFLKELSLDTLLSPPIV